MMILPEVKDAKNWWGGDIGKTMSAPLVSVSLHRRRGHGRDFGTTLSWLNRTRLFPGSSIEAQLEGKVGLLDPRTPGSGQSIWSFLRDIKGKSYLRNSFNRSFLESR